MLLVWNTSPISSWSNLRCALFSCGFPARLEQPVPVGSLHQETVRAPEARPSVWKVEAKRWSDWSWLILAPNTPADPGFNLFPIQLMFPPELQLHQTLLDTSYWCWATCAVNLWFLTSVLWSLKQVNFSRHWSAELRTENGLQLKNQVKLTGRNSASSRADNSHRRCGNKQPQRRVNEY